MELNDFIKSIEQISGLECFAFERQDTKLDHFFVSITDIDNHYADNKIIKQYTNLKLQYATKQSFNQFIYNKIICEQYNAIVSTSYNDSDGWYYMNFEININLSDINV